MKEHHARDFLIGLTAIGGLVGLGLMLFFFGEFRGTATYPINISLNSASGLYKASPVTLNGVRIGAVDELINLPDPRDGVLVALRVERGVQVPRDVQVSIDRSFVGDAALALRTTPRTDGPPDFLQPGDIISASADTMLEQIGSLLDERLGSLEGAADSIKRLADTYTRVGERVDLMLTPRTPEEVDAAGENAPPNIPSLVARLDRAAADVQGWAGDQELRADVKRAVARAADVMDQASEAVEAWTTTAQTLQARADQVGADAGQAARDLGELTRGLGAVADNLQAITGQLNDGKGTAGMLLTNPDLYNSLNDAARRLERALTEAQLLVEKYRKEGIPIRW